MKSHAAIEIDKPIDEVFPRTNEDVATWSLTCVEDELLEDKDGVGTTFRIVTEERGRRMDFDGVVTKWEPPTLSGVYLTGKQFDIDVDYVFEDLGGRTRVSVSSVVTGKGLFKLMLAVMGVFFRKSGCDAQSRELESLKSYCETGQPLSA